MNEQHIVYSLHDIAERNVDHTIDLWPAIRQRVQPQTATKPRTRFVPTTRLGWAAFALLVLVPVGVVLSSTLRDIYLQGDAALLYIEREGLNEELDLQQSVNGFTFRLQRVYADANRIVVGYTISGDVRETGEQQFHTSLELFDTAGNRIPGGEMTFDDEAFDGTMEAVVSFDPSGMEQLPDTVRAVVDLARLELTDDPSQWSGRKVANASFEFALPAAANVERRIVDINQTVEANGVAMTLQQVRISPTTAIVRICVDPLDHQLAGWVAFGTLATDPEQTDRVEKKPADVGSDTNCQKLSFYAPHFYERGGEWTLVVTELSGFDPTLLRAQEQGRMLDAEIHRQVSGPWTFTFDVPQP